METTREIPKIYKAISSVMGEVGAVEKSKQNKDQNYKYRGIDDVYNALNPVMSKHGIVIIPNIKERQEIEFQTKNNAVWKRVILTMEYTIYCAEDGSSLQTTLIGEGSDNSDKATNKAMSAAMKYLLFQIFCIPTEDLQDDADGKTPDEQTAPKPPETVYCCVECGAAFEPCEIRGKSYSSKDTYNIAIQTRKKPICKSCHEKYIITETQCELLSADTDADVLYKILSEFGYDKVKTVLKKDFDAIMKRLADEKLSNEKPDNEADTDMFGNELPWDKDDIPA